MNITSVGGRELYSILLGDNSPFGKPYNANPVELNETLNGERIEISNALKADPTKFQVSDIQNATSKIRRADCFEPSASFNLTELPKDKSSDNFERANDIDINDERVQSIVNNYIKVSLGSGMKGGIPTKERISEYYGNMAKRLDTAYSDGKFTKDEYDELNKMLSEHMEHITVCAERKAARRAIGGERGSLSPAAARPVILKQLSMTSEEYMAEMDAKISEYVEKHFKIDRTSLLAMFNSIRYGK